jgi:shikimate dehydrogenase
MISGQTRLYGLIGDPVEHSLSPFIHNRAFEKLGIDGVYTAFRVSSDDLAGAISGLRSLGAAGVNVTYPHKETVLQHADRLSPRVEVLQALNTLCFSANGVEAHNTDAPGAALAIERFGGRPLDRERVLIFGAGGAGRAGAMGVLEAGAASVSFCELVPSKAEAGLLRLQSHFPDRHLAVISMSDEERSAREAAIIDSSILINATPAMEEALSGPALIEDPGWVRPEHLCFEFSYHPRTTEFLRVSQAVGATCLDGLCLLVSQALESFRCWTGQEFDVEEMAAALEVHTGAGLVNKRE